MISVCHMWGVTGWGLDGYGHHVSVGGVEGEFSFVGGASGVTYGWGWRDRPNVRSAGRASTAGAVSAHWLGGSAGCPSRP